MPRLARHSLSLSPFYCVYCSEYWRYARRIPKATAIAERMMAVILAPVKPPAPVFGRPTVPVVPVVLVVPVVALFVTFVPVFVVLLPVVWACTETAADRTNASVKAAVAKP